MANSSMSRVVHLLVFATLFAAQVVCADDDVREPAKRRNTQESETSKRVFGGQQAKPGEYKALVFVNRRYSYTEMGKPRYGPPGKCTGTIVSPRWVLTAAHCLPIPYLYTYCSPNQDGRYSDIKVNITVRAGSVDLNNELDKSVTLSPRYPPVNQVDIIVHKDAVRFLQGNPNPEYARYFYDVALLKMAAEFPVNDVIAPVALMKGPIPEMFPKKCIALGFGRQAEINNDLGLPVVSGKLNYIYVIAGGTEFCKYIAQVTKWRRNQRICTHNAIDKRRMVCVGDSGSPLLCGSPGTHVVAAGVASRSIEKADCGQESQGTEYTYTGLIEDWVNNVTNNEVVFKPLSGKYTGTLKRFSHQSTAGGGRLGDGLRRPVAHLPPMILASVMLLVLCE